MAAVSLTARYLDQLKSHGTRDEVFDALVPGLSIRVSASGRKTFALYYRHRGRMRRLGLGRYPDVLLEKARKIATQHRGRIFNGADPAGEKQTEHAQDERTVQALYELYRSRNKSVDTLQDNPIWLSLTTMSRATSQVTEPKETALDRDAAALQEAVADLVRVYQFRDRDRICCHDVSVTQCYALETLVGHGPMRLSALAERLFLDKSTTSRVVNTLLRKGYVEQRADATDGRAMLINVTRQGQRLCARITSDLVGQQKQLLEDLAPEIRAGVVQVIQRLARAADARFRSGVTGGCCAPDSEAASCA
jgi:MarR family transcriptional regulator, 2-MHQ and catechol-resistance regulon repressor